MRNLKFIFIATVLVLGMPCNGMQKKSCNPLVVITTFGKFLLNKVRPQLDQQTNKSAEKTQSKDLVDPLFAAMDCTNFTTDIKRMVAEYCCCPDKILKMHYFPTHYDDSNHVRKLIVPTIAGVTFSQVINPSPIGYVESLLLYGPKYKCNRSFAFSAETAPLDDKFSETWYGDGLYEGDRFKGINSEEETTINGVKCYVSVLKDHVGFWLGHGKDSSEVMLYKELFSTATQKQRDTMLCSSSSDTRTNDQKADSKSNQDQ